MFVYTVDVGCTTTRPICPDQHLRTVVLLSCCDHHALLTACHMVGGRPGVEMVTSATITNLVL